MLLLKKQTGCKSQIDFQAVGLKCTQFKPTKSMHT